jgi:hypothetical protein
MKNIVLFGECLIASYVIVRGLQETALRLVNFLLRMCLLGLDEKNDK